MSLRRVLLALLALTLPGSASSAEPAAVPLRIQRVLVPQAARAQWAGDQSRYLPIDAARFERWLAARQGAADAAPPRARLRSASYEARLDDERRLVGVSRWDVEGPGPWPALLHLAPFDAQFDHSVWKRDAGDLEAVVGLTGERRLGLLVELPGRVESAWSLEPAANAGSERRYRLRFQECLDSRVALHLPEAVQASVDRGLVHREGAAQQGVQRWTLQCDARLEAELRLTWPEQERPAAPRFAVRQRMEYRLAPDGLTLEATIERAAQHWPAELELRTPPKLQLLEAHGAAGPLTWKHRSGEGGERFTVQTPAEPATAAGPIRLVFRGDFPHEAAVALPTLQIENARWEEGSARIVAAAPLRVARLTLTHARQTALEPDGAVRVQLFEPEAEIRAVASRSDAPLALLRGISLVADGANLTGVVLVELTTPRFEPQQLAAELAPDWRIESVEADPLVGTLEGWDQAEQRLTLQVARTVGDSRPLRLTIRGRRPLDRAATLSAADLRMLEFRQAIARRDLVSLRAVEPLRIQTRFAQDLTRVAPEDLDLESSRLLAEPPQGLCFAYDDSAERLRVAFLPGAPEATAELTTLLARTGEVWSEEFRVRITPSGRPHEEVLLRLSQSRPDLAWRLADPAGPRSLAAPRLSTAELVERGLAETDHVVRLNLPAAQAAAFELTARFEHPAADELQAALPSVLGVARQSGRVTVRSPAACGATASTSLTRIPTEAAAEGEPSWSAAYRYDATGPTTALELSLDASAANAAPADLWAWREFAQTRISANGRRLHTISHQLENRGGGELRLEWPQGWRLISAQLDGETAPLAGEAARGFSVALPASRRFVALRAEFEEAAPPLGWAQRLRPPTLETNYPVISRTWQVGTPERYEVWSPRESPRVSWGDRFLGPLARRAADSAPILGLEGVLWRGQPLFPGYEADQRSAALATASVGLARTERPTWGQWFAAWQAGLVQTGVEVLIDRGAAVRLGISPLDLAPRWSSRPTSQEVQRLLADAGWICRGSAGRLILTDGGGGQAASIDDGMSAGAPLVGTLAWRTGEGYPPSPWRTSTTLTSYAAEAPGAGLQFVTGDWAVVASREAKLALFTLAALAVAAAALAAYWFDLRAGLALGALCCAVAVAAPAAWVGCTAALPLGWLLASLQRALWPWLLRSAVRPATALGLSGLAVALVGASGFAAAPGLLAGVYRVLIPVDEDRRPRGTEYFVPLSLLSLIEADERAAAWPNGSPLLWTGAAYRLDLSNPENPRLRVTCDLHALAPDCSFTWPGKDPRWEIAEVRLDGRSWPTSADGAATVFLTQAGKRRAEFVLRPVAELRTVGRVEFEFPAQPAAQVSVSSPADSQGQLVRRIEPGPVATEVAAWAKPVDALGGRRLLVTIDSANAAAPPAPRELYWLNVRPDYVTIDAQLPKDAQQGALLALRSDQPLQAVAGSASGSSTALDASGQHRLELSASSATDGVLRTTLLTATSGVGQVSWPNLRPTTGAEATRWLAISIDPSLTWTLPPPDLAKAVPPEDFARVWGDSTSRPVAVVELPREPLEWSIETAPRPPATRGRVVAECDVSLRRARLEVVADLDTTAGFVLSHVLTLPENFVVESASVSQEGNDRLAYAARDGDALTLFLTTPVSGPHRLRIEGSLPMSAAGERTFAPWTLANVAAEPFELRLFRRVSVLAELSEIRDALRQELPIAHPDDRARRPLASLTATSPRFSVQVKVAPNEPRWEVHELVRRASGGGSAGYDLEVAVQVSEGRADGLRFRLPAGWSRPTIEAPGAAVDWLEGDAGETVLSLRFRTPLAGDYRFRATDWRPITPGDSTLPALASLDDERWQRFFAGPDSAGLAAEHGALPGFVAAPLPPALATMLPSKAAAWRIASLEATLGQPNLAPEAVPLVELADYSAHLDRTGRAVLTAAFDLRPAGAPEITLQLAADDELLGLDVDGVPASARESSPGQWTVQLQSADLPQRIEAVLMRRRTAEGTALAGPTLRLGSGQPPTVVETVWTVADERWPARPVGSATELDLDLRRLYNARDLVSATVAQSPGRDAGAWLRTWLPRWSEASRTAAAALDEANPGATIDQAALLRRTTARQQQELLLVAAERGWPNTANSMPERPAASRAFWAGLPAPVYRFAASGASPTFPPPSGAAPGRWLGRALVVIALGAALALGLAWSRRCLWPCVLPAALAVAGLLWAACCWAPWLGLGLAAWAIWQVAPRAWRLPHVAA